MRIYLHYKSLPGICLPLLFIPMLSLANNNLTTVIPGEGGIITCNEVQLADWNFNTNTINDVVTADGFASAGTMLPPVTVTGGSCKGCDAKMTLTFVNCDCVEISACKELSNVVIGTTNGVRVKYDNLSGLTGSFCSNNGFAIETVWVKAGCFKSGDGPGHGRKFNNPIDCPVNPPCANSGGDSDNDGVCDDVDCQPSNPVFPAIPGTPCDDGNINSINDVVTIDGCDCAGTVIDPSPCSCEGANIASIYVLYNGALCNEGNNDQSGEATCSGSIGSTTNTLIKVGKSSGSSEWFEGTLQPLQAFTIFSGNGGANQLDSDTYFTIGGQSGKFNTSCSKPIEVGDQFGGIQVLGIRFDNGSTCGETEENTIGLVGQVAEPLYFTAQKDGNDVSLYWVTNTGFKTDYFEVERSLDGVTFELINEVVGPSDSEQMVNYQDKDENAMMGINYYRLKQRFQDGSYRYSETKEVTFHLDLKKFVIYPNPTADDFFVNLKEFVGKAGTISVHTDLGQIVYKQHLEVITADHVRINTSGYAPGVHAVTVQIDDKKAMTELLIVVKR
jgi:Secretion system C-terminal sorting domain